MKTANEKTEELLEKLIYCDFRTEDGTDIARKYIRLALKDQDRDTRHACAEAINSAEPEIAVDGIREVIDVYKAYNLCINAKAI